jgi:DNA-binding transcriptional LysR family regulator
LNIEHLRYVLEVDRAGSISQAACNLYMGQPNLSKAIKELEQTLNIIIFRRTSMGTEVTPKGKEFLRRAKSILRQYEELEALGREDKSDTQSLRVSVPRASYVADAFTNFLTHLEDGKTLDMDFCETNALLAIKNVAEGHSGFGVIRCKTEYQSYFTHMLEENELMWRPLLEFHYLLLLSRDHPLAGKESVDAAELGSYIEIIHGDTGIPHMPQNMAETETGRTCGDRKIHIYGRGSQLDILARIPNAYMWASPMPDDLLCRNGLVQKHCGQGPDFADILIHQAGHKFGLLEKMFLSQLERSVHRILDSGPDQKETGK